MKTFDSILIRGADTVGSFVLATPFYRELRKNFPKSYIVLCIKPLVYELAKECPYVDKVIVYSTNFLENIKTLKKENFDTVFLISGSFESALVSFLAGIKNRIGYSHDHRGFLLTKKIVEKEKKHYVDYVLEILVQSGFSYSDKTLEIYVQNVESRYYDLIKGEKVIGINLTAVGDDARSWPKEYIATLIEKFYREGYQVITFGTVKDLSLSKFLKDKLGEKVFLDLIGKTSLSEFVSLVKRCNYFVAVATGGVHIAACLGIKTVALYCPGDDIYWCPVGKHIKIIAKYADCSPCNQHKMKYCKNNICMKQISVEEVLESVTNW